MGVLRAKTKLIEPLPCQLFPMKAQANSIFSFPANQRIHTRYANGILPLARSSHNKHGQTQYVPAFASALIKQEKT